MSEITPVFCPVCNAGLTASTGSLNPGDFATCRYCKTILIVMPNAGLRSADNHDYFNMPQPLRSQARPYFSEQTQSIIFQNKKP